MAAAPTGGELPRPPRRCTPAQFYTEYLPELWRELAGDLVWPSYTYDLGFVVTGAAPESFTLTYDGGVIRGRAGAAAHPVAELRGDEASFRLMVHEVIPRGIKRTNKRLPAVRAEMATAAKHTAPRVQPDAVRAMPGVIEIDFTDDTGDRGLYRIAIGGGAGPTARIAASDQDLWALLECGGQLTSLLKSRAQLDGEVGYLFKLARFFEGS